MAYYSGAASTLSELRSALFSACSSHGWSIVGSGNVLQKGAACLVVSVSGNSLSLSGGTGVSGASVTGAMPFDVRLGEINASVALVFPVSYEIFLFENPDEVFLVVKSGLDKYYWLAFGVSDVPGVLGTGLWVGATATNANGPTIDISASGGGAAASADRRPPAALFWATAYAQNAYIHHDFDGLGWGPGQVQDMMGTVGVPNAVASADPLIARSPSAWNSDSPLIPIQVSVQRASNKRSLVCDIRNARYIRVSNYEPGALITLGGDQWKVFPWYRKDTSAPGGGSGISHTGTFGWAIRYEGP